MKIILSSKTNLHSGIYLPDGEPVVIGRNKTTKIVDIRCSRNQLQLTADYSAKHVNVKNLASFYAMVGERRIEKGEMCQMKIGDTLTVVGKDFPHQLIIEDVMEKDGEPVKKKRKISSVEKSVDADLMNSSSEGLGGWKKINDELLVYESKDLKHSSKIASFDLDGTIITTKSGKKFPVDKEDWMILLREIPEKLKQLHKDGFKLVLITNQKGVSTGQTKEEDLKTKIEAIIRHLKIPFQVLASIKGGKYRKPNVGTFNWLQAKGNGSILLDKDQFFYVGDAAGRPKNWNPGKKKDFSCSDRLFAINISCKFYTPEEFFLSQKEAKFEMPKFDPRNIKSDETLVKCSTFDKEVEINKKEQELIIFVGSPACGKSTFANEHINRKKYSIINRDILKTQQKCVAACEAALSSGKSCVIDNTNPDEDSRKRYIDLAKKFTVPCRCFHFDMDIEQVFHNNKFRVLTKVKHDLVSPMVIYSYRKKHVTPKLSEGFQEILQINFVPKFANQEFKDLYYKFLA